MARGSAATLRNSVLLKQKTYLTFSQDETSLPYRISHPDYRTA
jgi:hypothetical protein